MWLTGFKWWGDYPHTAAVKVGLYKMHPCTGVQLPHVNFPVTGDTTGRWWLRVLIIMGRLHTNIGISFVSVIVPVPHDLSISP